MSTAVVESCADADVAGRIGPRRNFKLQICLSDQERVQLRERARAARAESLASYVRACALTDGNEAETAVRA